MITDKNNSNKIENINENKNSEKARNPKRHSKSLSLDDLSNFSDSKKILKKKLKLVRPPPPNSQKEEFYLSKYNNSNKDAKNDESICIIF